MNVLHIHVGSQKMNKIYSSSLFYLIIRKGHFIFARHSNKPIMFFENGIPGIRFCHKGNDYVVLYNDKLKTHKGRFVL